MVVLNPPQRKVIAIQEQPPTKNWIKTVPKLLIRIQLGQVQSTKEVHIYFHIHQNIKSINHLILYNESQKLIIPVMQPNVGEVIETIANTVLTLSKGYFSITFI